MKYYLFAKFYQNFTPEQLAERCAELGFDGPTALVRDGYPLTAANLKEALPSYIRTMEAAGMEVKFADAPVNPLREDADYLVGTLAEHGIERIRLDHIGKAVKPARELADYARYYAEAAAKLAERHGTKAVIQLHGHCYPHNATAAYPCVKDLDPRYIGVKMDPGNNLAQEGYELFDYQIKLLGEYLTALGAKSAGIFRGEDGIWRRGFVPAQEGIADYNLIMRTLKEIDFDGPAVLMPFYNDREPDVLTEKLKDELAFFKACEKRANEA
ncbi:MAG: sugar phosphate isomerase/epimerase [Clostridia bacterium]|nr:sugar phosphate isomerase/epimerase [Clostridia bacterium]